MVNVVLLLSLIFAWGCREGGISDEREGTIYTTADLGMSGEVESAKMAPAATVGGHDDVVSDCVLSRCVLQWIGSNDRAVF